MKNKMQWKYVGIAGLLIQNLWLFRDYLSLSSLFVTFFTVSICFFMNSKIFSRNIESYKHELEQMLGFYLEIPTNIEDESSKCVVDDALTAMKYQLDAAKEERDNIHHQLIKARQEIRKEDTHFVDNENLELHSTIAHPSGSTTICKFNSRNKQLEKQLKVAEQQLRQQGLREIAQALADADIRVQRAAEAERKFDKVLKHVVFLEKEKKISQRRFEQLQKLTNNLTVRLNEIETQYQNANRQSLKIQESLIKKKEMATELMNQAQKEANDAKLELEYYRKNTNLILEEENFENIINPERSTTKTCVPKTKNTTSVSNRSDFSTKKQKRHSNKSLPTMKQKVNIQDEHLKLTKGGGDRFPCENKTSFISTNSTSPELCAVDAASMVSLVSTESLVKRDEELDLIWSHIQRPHSEDSQRFLNPSPEFSSLLARLEEEEEL